MLLQGARLNQSALACPADRLRCKAFVYAGCTVPAVAHRRGKGTAISGMAVARRTPPMLRVTSTSLPVWRAISNELRRGCAADIPSCPPYGISAEALLSNRFLCRQWATTFRSGWFLFGWQGLDHNSNIQSVEQTQNSAKLRVFLAVEGPVEPISAHPRCLRKRLDVLRLHYGLERIYDVLEVIFREGPIQTLGDCCRIIAVLSEVKPLLV